MNLLSRLLRLHLPLLVREKILDELFAGTAAGFGCAVPRVEAATFEERLEAYARFTREESERAIREGRDLDALQARLRDEAFALGRRLRGYLGIEGMADALTVARPLYGAIGIDFRATPTGEVTVDRCFFSRYYSPEVCRLIAGLDEGVLAGMAGGGRLAFTQRLTEGYPCCKARFTPEDGQP